MDGMKKMRLARWNNVCGNLEQGKERRDLIGKESARGCMRKTCNSGETTSTRRLEQILSAKQIYGSKGTTWKKIGGIL